MPELPQLAARLLDDARSGARASARLSELIRLERLDAAAAEQLSALLYGALRLEARASAALQRTGLALPRAAQALPIVVAAALLEGRMAAERAGELVSEVAWRGLEAADREECASAVGARKVALLGSLPGWLAEQLLLEYGAEAEALAASLAEPAPRALRVNGLVSDVDEALQRLSSEGASVVKGRYGKRALLLSGAFNPFTTRAFHDGVFELQDEGSQIASELAAPPPRGLVLDGCAGAGGKALSIAAALAGRGKIVALDVDEGKLAELRRRAKRAHAANVQALVMDESGPLPADVLALQGKVERLLIDAPCSGTGVLRRNPETRARLTPEVVERLVVTQRAILERLLPLLAPGGRLVFVTCSLLRAEGEQLMDGVEAAHPELEPVNLAELYDRAYIDRFVRSAPHRVRLLPHLHGTDGFFVSVLRRKR